MAPSGQPLSTVVPAAGDGISTAAAQGGNGGLFAGSFLYAEITGTPSVAVTIAALQLIAGADVVLTADSAFQAGSSANTDLGGAIAVGTVKSWTDLGDSPTSIDIAAGTTVSAGRDVTATGLIDHNITSSGRAVGGGLIAVNDAQTHAFVDDDVTIAVGSNGVVTAGRALRMDIAATVSASTSSETWLFGGGVFSFSDHNNSDSRGVRIGTAADPAMRSITIGTGAQLTARTVELDAAVVALNLNAKAKAESYCPLFCTATAYADAEIDLYSSTLVQVLANAVITGYEGVDLKARHVDTVAGDGNSLNIIRDVYSIAVAIIPPQRSTLAGTDSMTNEVNTDAHALVIAGARAATPAGGLFPSQGGLNTALFVLAHSDAPNYPQTHDDLWDQNSTAIRAGNIYWDADVIILGGSGGQGYLVVGTDGRVLAANGVQVRNGAGTLVTPVVGNPVPLFGGQIVVGAIVPSGAADIDMQADDSIANQDYAAGPAGNPNAAWPTFEFRSTLSDVTIVNQAPLDLVIEGVQVMDDGSDRNPRVRLIGLNGGQPISYSCPGHARVRPAPRRRGVVVRRHRAAQRDVAGPPDRRLHRQPDRPDPPREPQRPDHRHRRRTSRHQPARRLRAEHHRRLDRQRRRPSRRRPRALPRLPVAQRSRRRFLRSAPRRRRRCRRLPQPPRRRSHEHLHGGDHHRPPRR